MANPLATTDDVADLWRPFTSTDEQARVSRLVVKASALLRQALPWVDARIARFNADPTDLGGLDPVLVANVVATICKRFLVNPDGATNTTETSGPFSHAKGFALRGDKDVRGELFIAESDILALMPAKKTKSRIGTIKARPRMAPWPYGDLGNPAVGAAYGGVDAMLVEEGMSDPSWEFGPFINYPAGE
jgi:hypothetical protein